MSLEHDPLDHVCAIEDVMLLIEALKLDQVEIHGR